MSADVLPFRAAASVFLLPEGVYSVAFVDYRLATKFGRGSLEMRFEVMDFGQFFKQTLSRHYKIERQGKRTFRASRHSAYCREFAAVFGRTAPNGTAGVNSYRELLIDARVRTVSKDHRQKALPEVCRYSVIDELLRRTT